MRALICRPGTTLVIGGRLAALGAITPRSVFGVNANGGRPGSELLAGVVSGFVVVRSVLSKQVTSARRGPTTFSTSAQVTAALAESGASRTQRGGADHPEHGQPPCRRARAGTACIYDTVATRNARYYKKRCR